MAIMSVEPSNCRKGNAVYLRFVVTEIDPDSHKPQGLFIAADTLMEFGDLSTDERQSLKEILHWFNKNLIVPTTSSVKGRAIFWFRASAHDCIQRMWTLVAVFRVHGKLVEIQKCPFLGNVVYYDALQVAAYPHKRDGQITFK
jgi:hypothetical protein